MSLPRILLYPDPILKQRSVPITPGDPTIAAVIDEMLAALEASPGVALAAPQIGHLVQIIVVDVARKKGEQGHGRVLLCNPRIVRMEGPKLVREGCLSVPDYTGNVLRHDEATVEGLTPDGARVTIEAKGFEALAFQHEVDHLEGRLFLDRIQSLSTDLFRRKSR